MNVSLKVHNKRGALNVIVDSTGLKVYGKGEWKVKKHGISKRRTWRKLHVMIDAKTQRIAAAETTSNSAEDASVVPNLLIFCPTATARLKPCAEKELTINEKSIKRLRNMIFDR